MKIVLAGSMSCLEKINIVKATLEDFGHTVVAPRFTEDESKTGVNTFTDYFTAQNGIKNVLPNDRIWNIKEIAMFEYKKLMDEADALLVCNFDKGERKNRIGANAFLEMGYMFFASKKLYILQSPPYDDDKIEEILGMKPTFLYGDLEKLK